MKLPRFASALILLLATATVGLAFDVQLPVIPEVTFDITHYGAVGDGKTLDTEALQNTVDAAIKAGGGIVLVPAGTYLTGPFTLGSRINLHLAKGAVILLSNDRDHYPASKKRYEDAITAHEAHDLAISGEGVIDGQGADWWAAFRAHESMMHRPYLIKLLKCVRVSVTGITLQNSPMFHLVPQECSEVTIRDITIHAAADAPNTDGIDPSGWNFLITGCNIDTGDDNIAIKPDQERSPGNKNFLITNCHFGHGHGMSVGGGSAGGLENLTVRDCTFDNTDSGIRIKTHRGGGGLLHQVTYENLTMHGVRNPIYIIDWYPEHNAPAYPATEPAYPVNPLTPFNQDITIRNVTATGSPNAGTIRGLPEAPITRVLLDHVSLSAATGMKLYHARNIQFISSQITVQSGPNLLPVDAQFDGLTPSSQP